MQSLTEIAEGLWRLELPLPRNPLRSINVYLLLDEDRPLVVDVGLETPESEALLREAFARLRIDPAHSDFFLTHKHIDHSGQIAKIVPPGAKVLLGEEDQRYIGQWRGWEGMAEEIAREGFPVGELMSAVKGDPYLSFTIPDLDCLQGLHGGEVLEKGGRAWTVIHTPGHSGGHLCLYAAKDKILIAGDHILGDISPNIQGWRADSDRLGLYLESLDRIAMLDVDLLLPGHRRPILDHRKRVRELIELHEKRLDEVRRLLAAGSLTGYEAASRMTWDLTFARWEEWPLTQQWFATGEALSHLHRLRFLGEAERVEEGKVVRFRLTK